MRKSAAGETASGLHKLAVVHVVKALERNARDGDRLLIAADTGTGDDVCDVLSDAAGRFGIDYELLVSRPVAAPNAEPDREMSEAIGRSDLIMLATSVPISHTAAVRAGIERGGRIVAMDGVTVEMLALGGASADYELMHGLGLVLEELWNASTLVRVTSEAGTDFEADVAGRKSWRWDGYTFSADWYSLTGCALPDGEVGIAPLEGSANGVVVWDTSVHSLGLLREPVTLHVESGWVTRIEGGDQAKELAVHLESLDDRNSYYCPAEIAIGINPDARITGAMREDKKKQGTVHIATGTNVDIGGTITAKTHIDGLILQPSLWLDGEQILSDGRLLVSAE